MCHVTLSHVAFLKQRRFRARLLWITYSNIDSVRLALTKHTQAATHRLAPLLIRPFAPCHGAILNRAVLSCPYKKPQLLKAISTLYINLHAPSPPMQLVSLPSDILIIFLQHLTVHDLGILSRTCRLLNILVCSNASVVSNFLILLVGQRLRLGRLLAQPPPAIV